MRIKFTSYPTLHIIPASYKSRCFYTPSLFNLGLSHVNICRLLESCTVVDRHHNLPSFDLYVTSQRDYSEYLFFHCSIHFRSCACNNKKFLLSLEQLKAEIDKSVSGVSLDWILWLLGLFGFGFGGVN